MTDMTLARAFPARNFPAQGRSAGTGSVTPPIDTLIALPFDAGGDFDAITALLKTGGGGSAVMRAGIYDCDSTGLPGSLLESTGEYETDGGHQGQIDLILNSPITLTDPYWVVALFGGEEVSMLASAALPTAEIQHLFGITNSSLQSGVFNPATANAATASYSYAALPSTFPTPTLAGSSLWLSVRSSS